MLGVRPKSSPGPELRSVLGESEEWTGDLRELAGTVNSVGNCR